MGVSAEVFHLQDGDWAILRAVRLRALRENGDSFAGDYAVESGLDESHWHDQIATQDWCAVRIDDSIAAIMGVDIIDRHECNCWVHGCWVDPAHRGHGLTRLMVDWLDGVSVQRDWCRQGLGVWPENIRAISVWERLGFEVYGAPQPSRRRPGQVYVAMRREVPDAVRLDCAAEEALPVS